MHKRRSANIAFGIWVKRFLCLRRMIICRTQDQPSATCSVVPRWQPAFPGCASSPASWPPADRIRIDPGDEVTAAIPDCAANLNKRGPGHPDPPGLQRPNREAQQVGSILLPQKGVCVEWKGIRGHLEACIS